MGTKTTKTKSAGPAKRAAKSKPAAEQVAAPAPAPTRTKPKAGVTTKKPAVRRAKVPTYSQEEVALRAYFIAERRQAAGWAGDSHQDWIEAERQLAAEFRTPSGAKASKA